MDSTTKPSLARNGFRRFAQAVAWLVGHPLAFAAALIVLVMWGVSGPVFRFSDTWQLVINTATSVVTFLMVFVIQNTQNRDARAIHLKLDELIRTAQGARNEMLDLETSDDAKLDALRLEFAQLREQHVAHEEHIEHEDSEEHDEQESAGDPPSLATA